MHRAWQVRKLRLLQNNRAIVAIYLPLIIYPQLAKKQHLRRKNYKRQAEAISAEITDSEKRLAQRGKLREF